jgi:hypothetical protein
VLRVGLVQSGTFERPRNPAGGVTNGLPEPRRQGPIRHDRPDSWHDEGYGCQQMRPELAKARCSSRVLDFRA